MSNKVATLTGALQACPQSAEETMSAWFSAGVLKFSKLTYTRPAGATAGYESWSRSESLGRPNRAAEQAGLNPLMVFGSLQFAPSSENETAIGKWSEAVVGLKNWLKGVQVTYTRFLKGLAGKVSTPRKGLSLNKFGPKPFCLGVMAVCPDARGTSLLQGRPPSSECVTTMPGPGKMPPGHSCFSSS